MKNIFYILMLLVVFSACKEESLRFSKSEVDADNPLVGKWQLVKSSYSIGTAEQHWQEVQDGYILNLKKDKRFETNKPNASSGGTYEIEGDKLILTYAGNAEPAQYTDRYFVDGDTLSLSPLSPIICIEGCSSKLVRIN